LASGGEVVIRVFTRRFRAGDLLRNREEEEGRVEAGLLYLEERVISREAVAEGAGAPSRPYMASGFLFPLPGIGSMENQ
jgi:hypothetical protein